MPHTDEPIHQSTLTDDEWKERLRTENAPGQLTRLLAQRAAKAEAPETGRST